MKQGPSTSSAGDTKREPISHGVNPGGAAQLGTMVIKNPVPLYLGRGIEAPKTATTIHHSGSQGKHK